MIAKSGQASSLQFQRCFETTRSRMRRLDTCLGKVVNYFVADDMRMVPLLNRHHMNNFNNEGLRD